MVRSSSFLKKNTTKSRAILHNYNKKTYVPAFKSDTTEGLMETGGTNILVKIKSFGCDLEFEKVSIFVIKTEIEHKPASVHR
jgi:hypothetical protein